RPRGETYFNSMVSSFGATHPRNPTTRLVETAQKVGPPPHHGLAREELVLLVDGTPQRLEVIRQPRHLGGTQAYWVCPKCETLRSDLYMVGGVLQCRVCGALSYRSRALQRHKAVLRVARLRKRLRAEPSLLAPVPPRPPRWSRVYYGRLVAELAKQEAIVAQALGGIVKALERRKGRLHGPR